MSTEINSFNLLSEQKNSDHFSKYLNVFLKIYTLLPQFILIPNKICYQTWVKKFQSLIRLPTMKLPKKKKKKVLLAKT